MIYQNFDKLEISFKGALPEHVLNDLNEAKKKAQNTKRPMAIEIGNPKQKFSVQPCGLGGMPIGFISANEGLQLGAQNSEKKDQWNLFVGVRSFYLALHGYEAVKQEIIFILNALGAKTHERLCPFTGEYTTFPLESIKRFDYCFDQIIEGFVPNRDNVTFHSNGRIKQFGQIDISVDRRGAKDNALTIGSIKSNQVQLYDKILEIKQKGNEYLYEIWGIEKEKARDIWRLEVRFGKDYIRRNDLRTFHELEHNLPDVLQKSLKNMRYKTPNTDSNKSRWEDAKFWTNAIEAAREALNVYTTDVDTDIVYTEKRERSRRSVEDMLPGLFISYAVLNDIPYSEIGDVPKRLNKDFKALLDDCPMKMQKKYVDVHKRYNRLSDYE